MVGAEREGRSPDVVMLDSVAMADPLSARDAGVRERLVEAARLAAVGRLLPSLAHQLSTPLASIALRAESLGRDPEAAAPSPARAERYLQAIVDDTGRCKELLGLMRDFARPPGDEREPVDLNVLCRGAARLVLHEAMRRQVEVRLDLADALPALVGQEVRLRGAVLSLILNAIDASPAGGRVTVGTSARPGETTVMVTDEGEGITEDNRRRLFEPFFSTRPRGLGVSLLACRAVAEAHGGTVDVESQPGQGSRFTLRFPEEPSGREGGDVPRT
jgi:signal transduction histidine kinase